MADNPQIFDIPIGKVVGPKGDTGNGISSIELLQTAGLNKTYRITMTDETYFDFVVTDGNGISSVSFNPETYTLTLVFDNGTSYTTGSLRGAPGQKGDDGYSPTITVTNITGGHRVTITDKNGTQTVDVMDGTNGTDGTDGYSPVVTVTDITGGHRVTITDADHPTGQSFDVMDGQDGASDAGEVTFDPTLTYPDGSIGAEVSAQKNTVDQLESDLDMKAPVIINTASGEIVTFDDGADNLKIRKVVGAIVPQQDLHGYDAPWPAGGGKNLFNPQYFLDAGCVLENGYYKGTPVQIGNALNAFNASFTFEENTRYALSYTIRSDANVYFRLLFNYTDSTSSQATPNSSTTDQRASGVSTSGKNVSSIRSDYSNNGTIWIKDVQLEKSATVTDYAPYSNICPISGWPGANVTQCAKNLFGGITFANKLKALDSRVVINTTNGTVMYFAGWLSGKNIVEGIFKPNMPYTFYVKIADGNNRINLGIRYTDGTIEVGEFTDGVNVVNSNGNKTIESLYGRHISGDTVLYYDQFGIFEGIITADEFASYVATTLPINWQSEAGTIYGGSITLNEDRSADVVATHTIVDLGALSWSKSGDSPIDEFIGVASPSVVKAYGRSNIICTAYATNTANVSIPNLPDHTISGQTNNRNIYIRDDTATTGAELKALLSGIYAVYEMNSPQPYHLDSIGELYTYLGTNNVWIDTGSITECDYPADTKTYVDNGSAVDDVQINGTSIVTDGVANIQKASASVLGVVKVGVYGINIDDSGVLFIVRSNENTAKDGQDQFKIVTPYSQHYSAFYGLAKAAGHDEKNSALAFGTYTEDAKAAIHTMLNAPVTVSGTTPTIAAKDGITYICGEVATLDITIPASGIFEVQFVSGSTPTVLTATGVSWVGGFDPTALEANKTYDISISNGIGVAVWI